MLNNSEKLKSWMVPSNDEKLLAYCGWVHAADRVAFTKTVSNIWFCGYEDVCEILMEIEIEVEGK